MVNPYESPQKSTEPEIPARISREQLWGWLLGPPAVVLLMNFGVEWFAKKDAYGGQFLLTVPVGLLAIIMGTIFFAVLIARKYRGGKLACMVVGYLLGEFVVCLGVWIGSCLIIAN